MKMRWYSKNVPEDIFKSDGGAAAGMLVGCTDEFMDCLSLFRSHVRHQGLSRLSWVSTPGLQDTSGQPTQDTAMLLQWSVKAGTKSEIFLCESYFRISVFVCTLCHTGIIFPLYSDRSPPPGVVSVGLCWLWAGWHSKPPHLRSRHAKAHPGAAQHCNLLQVGPHCHHLFLRRHLGGDSHQGLTAFNFSFLSRF